MKYKLCTSTRVGLMAVLLCSLICLPAAESLAVSVGGMPADKILFLGNSLTHHPPNFGIGWYGDWGMDASSQAKDYAHVTASKIAAINGGASPEVMAVNIYNYGGFEQNFANYDAATELSSLVAWDPDIVVFQLGDNSTSLVTTPEDVAAFSAGYADVLAQFADKEKFAVSTWWPSATMDSLIYQGCTDAGGTFVDIGSLFQNTAYRGGWSGHPNDAGMTAIANCVWDGIINSAPPVSGEVVINVDFENIPAVSASVTQTGQGALPAPGDIWNSITPAREPDHAYYGDIVASYGSIFSGGIVDSRGLPTGVSVSATSLGHVYSWTGYDPLGEAVSCTSHSGVMDDWLIDENETSLVVISGLVPNGSYDLALYGHSHEGEGNTQFTINGDTRSTGYATESHALTEGIDYLVYEDVTANSLGRIQISFTEDPVGIHHGGFNGFQIRGDTYTGPPLEEPAVADENILSDMPASASSTENDWYPTTATDGNAVVTNGVNSDWVAPNGDPNPRLAVWGFDSAIDKIRVWGAGDLDPDEIRILSSTSLISPTDGDFASDLADSYETELLPMTPTDGLGISAGLAGDRPWQTFYMEFDVDAPAGTQSLLFDCGASGRTRIIEVQAFGSALLPGDATGDGSVDVSDLGVLATNYGAGGGFGWSDGDFTGDGFVDVSDLGILATNYGMSSASSVPEPAVCILLLTGLLGLLLRIRRR